MFDMPDLDNRDEGIQHSEMRVFNSLNFFKSRAKDAVKAIKKRLSNKKDYKSLMYTLTVSNILVGFCKILCFCTDSIQNCDLKEYF